MEANSSNKRSALVFYAFIILIITVIRGCHMWLQKLFLEALVLNHTNIKALCPHPTTGGATFQNWTMEAMGLNSTSFAHKVHVLVLM